MNPQNTQASLDQQDPEHNSGILPIAALIVSILSAVFLFVLVFIFSDPSGDDIGVVEYSLLAITIGLVGMGAIGMARRARIDNRPFRKLSIVAICIGGATIFGVGAFFFFGFVAGPLANWLIWD